MPQTKADSELQPMFAGQAPFFANALLGVRALISTKYNYVFGCFFLELGQQIGHGSGPLYLCPLLHVFHPLLVVDFFCFDLLFIIFNYNFRTTEQT